MKRCKLSAIWQQCDSSTAASLALTASSAILCGKDRLRDCIRAQYARKAPLCSAWKSRERVRVRAPRYVHLRNDHVLRMWCVQHKKCNVCVATETRLFFGRQKNLLNLQATGALT